jgi:hypothetical protein
MIWDISTMLSAMLIEISIWDISTMLSAMLIEILNGSRKCEKMQTSESEISNR